MEKGLIEVAPLAYMRGRTLDNAFIPYQQIGLEEVPPHGQAYVMGYLILQSIVDRWGIEALGDIERNHAASGSWEESVKLVTGCTPADIFKDVNELDFNTIFSNEPKANYSDYEWNKIKPVRSAEILFPSAISTQYISKIIFRSECDKERAQYILGNDTRFIVDKDKFCNEWLYVDHYDYDRKEKKLLIHYHKGQKYKDWCRLSDYHHTMRKYDDKGNILDERDCTDWFEKEVKAMGIQLGKDESAAFLVYYIDGIECMRLKIND